MLRISESKISRIAIVTAALTGCRIVACRGIFVACPALIIWLLIKCLFLLTLLRINNCYKICLNINVDEFHRDTKKKFEFRRP